MQPSKHPILMQKDTVGVKNKHAACNNVLRDQGYCTLQGLVMDEYGASA
jgi:hypothetical protein